MHIVCGLVLNRARWCRHTEHCRCMMIPFWVTSPLPPCWLIWGLCVKGKTITGYFITYIAILFKWLYCFFRIENRAVDDTLSGTSGYLHLFESTKILLYRTGWQASWKGPNPGKTNLSTKPCRHPSRMACSHYHKALLVAEGYNRPVVQRHSPLMLTDCLYWCECIKYI